ncbi:hypothetical protein MAR_001486 [Mya arenaria]|uniref:Uncharacterized protein n=1 Tax=Mya arenaria TaxID=6604 RepID=A0ABY7FBW2_MYAAR|nr:hypothetical protein MAR_001486 [Mya arenaria]
MSSSAGAKGSKWTGHLEYYDYQTNTEKIFKEVSQLKETLMSETGSLGSMSEAWRSMFAFYEEHKQVFQLKDLLTADKIVAYNNFKELCFWEQWFTNNNVNEPSRDHRNEIVQTYDPHELNHILDVNRILPIYSSKDSSHVKPWMELQVSNDQSEMFRPYDPHLLIIMCMSYEIKSQVQLLSN